jgi:undecaprenyl diphosphate synthase
MIQAVKAWRLANPEEPIDLLTEETLSQFLSTENAPEVDLVIRTGGESRISNFMLWQAAYAEMFFCDALWPDFTTDQLNTAIEWFKTRDRRFGSSAPL